jgi:mRNA interferase MazF
VKWTWGSRLATKSGSRYVPERGDVVWLSFDPQAGHEQAGRRPALVLSPSTYNRSSGLAVVVPITSHVKGYPFEVRLPAGLRVSGAILADQLKSVDWRARNAERIGVLPDAVANEALKKAALLLTAAG